VGIAKNETIAIADQASYRETTIEERDGLSEDADQVKLPGGIFVRTDKEMVDHFHHGSEVALFLEFARFDPNQIE
jgi:hypothetical protein